MTHWNTLAGLMDFSVIEGLSEWPETQAELDRLLPLPSSLMRSLANLIRLLLSRRRLIRRANTPAGSPH